MKYHISLAFFLLTVSTTNFLHAQDSDNGIRLGLNISSFSGDDADLYESSRTGLVVGIYYDYVYNHIFSLEAGMNFSQSGVGNTADSSTLKLSYIDFPILAKFSLNNNIRLFTGPQFGLLASAKFGDDSSVDDNLKTQNYSLILGAEYQLNLGLAFSVRYIRGLNSIVETDFIPTQEVNLDLINQSVQISVGYLF